MTPEEIKAAKALCDGFRGRFFYDAERGDIGYIAKACDDRECDCELKTNSDGDQDCSISVASETWDEHVTEAMVGMLNAVPALIAEVERLRANMPSKWKERHDEVHGEYIKAFRQAEEVTAERDTLKRLLGEALDIAKQAYAHDGDHSAVERIAAIAKEAGL